MPHFAPGFAPGFMVPSGKIAAPIPARQVVDVARRGDGPGVSNEAKLVSGCGGEVIILMPVKYTNTTVPA